ncbi:hypothetical protein FRB97_009606 [Tulasnella sp. 331]|nr:hypothetical protein FRB97_009606 [Tulasnella sp. 331]
MSLPPINASKSTAGISVDPKTLERIVAPTKRADGSVRKELKIRPGFTPQEDVGVFRGSRQAALEARKTGGPGGGRIIPGWAPPESDAKPKPPKSKGMSPNPNSSGVGGSKGTRPQQKKKEVKKVVPEPVKDSWEEDEEMAEGSVDATTNPKLVKPDEGVKDEDNTGPPVGEATADFVGVEPSDDGVGDLTNKLGETKV